MLKISYHEHVTNVEILNRMSTEAEQLRTIKTRTMVYYGYVRRYPEEEKTPASIGSRGWDRGVSRTREKKKLKNSWRADWRSWFHCSNQDLREAAKSKQNMAGDLKKKKKTETKSLSETPFDTESTSYQQSDRNSKSWLNPPTVQFSVEIRTVVTKSIVKFIYLRQQRSVLKKPTWRNVVRKQEALERKLN